MPEPSRARRLLGRARDARAQARAAQAPSSWCAATWPAAAGSSTRRRAPSAGTSCPPGLQEASAARADLHARRPRRRRPARREHHHRADGAACVGAGDRGRLRDRTLDVYRRRGGVRRGPRHHPGGHEVRVAAVCRSAKLILIDEVLTPDSSRFWPKELAAGRGAAVLRQADRARLRCSTMGWNKQPPAPIAAARRARARRAALPRDLERLTGRAGRGRSDGGKRCDEWRRVGDR